MLFIYLFSFLLTINLKLIIVDVEIKIVNKEAATKRCTLLYAQQYNAYNVNLNDVTNGSNMQNESIEHDDQKKKY